MAFTKSLITETVMGNQRVRVFNVTPDASTGSIDTGFPQVKWAEMSIKSMAAFIASGATSQTFPNYQENKGPTGTSINGTIGFSGCVSGDVYRVVVYNGS